MLQGFIRLFVAYERERRPQHRFHTRNVLQRFFELRRDMIGLEAQAEASQRCAQIMTDCGKHS